MTSLEIIYSNHYAVCFLLQLDVSHLLYSRKFRTSCRYIWEEHTTKFPSQSRTPAVSKWRFALKINTQACVSKSDGMMSWLGRSCKYLQYARTLLQLAPGSNKHLNLWSLKTKQYEVQHNSTNPDVGCPVRLGPSSKLIHNSIKLTCFEITTYRINYCTVLWLLELQIRRGRKV
jgi:hypothetical protein